MFIELALQFEFSGGEMENIAKEMCHVQNSSRKKNQTLMKFIPYASMKMGYDRNRGENRILVSISLNNIAFLIG